MVVDSCVFDTALTRARDFLYTLFSSSPASVRLRWLHIFRYFFSTTHSYGFHDHNLVDQILFLNRHLHPHHQRLLLPYSLLVNLMALHARAISHPRPHHQRLLLPYSLLANLMSPHARATSHLRPHHQRLLLPYSLLVNLKALLARHHQRHHQRRLLPRSLLVNLKALLARHPHPHHQQHHQQRLLPRSLLANLNGAISLLTERTTASSKRAWTYLSSKVDSAVGKFSGTWWAPECKFHHCTSLALYKHCCVYLT